MNKLLFAIILALSINASAYSVGSEGYAQPPVTFERDQCLHKMMLLTSDNLRKLKYTHNYSSEKDSSFFGFAWGVYYAQCIEMFDGYEQSVAGDIEFWKKYIEDDIGSRLIQNRIYWQQVTNIFNESLNKSNKKAK